MKSVFVAALTGLVCMAVEFVVLFEIGNVDYGALPEAVRTMLVIYKCMLITIMMRACNND